MAVSILLVCVLGYLLGNINGAVLLSKLVEKDDVRRHGSGNAGFTNFFRSYGKANSLFVILIDGLKAAAACLLGSWLLGKYGYRTEGMLLGGLAVTLGHDFPALLGFHGGKGIVCGFAAALTTDWRIALIMCSAWPISPQSMCLLAQSLARFAFLYASPCSTPAVPLC